MRWIQSFAHEQPGADLLLVVERGRRAPGRRGPVRVAVERLLDELRGALIEWWQPFADGSLAVRVAREPHRFAPAPPPEDPGDGRTDATAGRAYLPPDADIPEPLLGLALRAAELRRTREGQAVGVGEVVLREVWIEAQAAAMAAGTGWEAELERIAAEEAARLRDALDRE